MTHTQIIAKLINDFTLSPCVEHYAVLLQSLLQHEVNTIIT